MYGETDQCGCIVNVDGRKVFPYRCPRCGQCLFHRHTFFWQGGQWYVKGPCGTHPA
ncbi:MAG TPA: hypothetical protein VJV74_11445 [Terriglobia bacterium]|nr:hypothetical protein [Terriglobia bacterium]